MGRDKRELLQLLVIVHLFFQVPAEEPGSTDTYPELMIGCGNERMHRVAGVKQFVVPATTGFLVYLSGKSFVAAYTGNPNACIIFMELGYLTIERVLGQPFEIVEVAVINVKTTAACAYP